MCLRNVTSFFFASENNIQEIDFWNYWGFLHLLPKSAKEGRELPLSYKLLLRQHILLQNTTHYTPTPIYRHTFNKNSSHPSTFLEILDQKIQLHYLERKQHLVSKWTQSHLQYRYRLRDKWTESSPAEEDLGIPVDKDVRQASKVRSQPGKPVLSWAGSNAAWLAGQGRWFSRSVPLPWDPTWSPASGSGVPSTRQTWTSQRRSRGGRKLLEGWNTSPMKTKSWRTPSLEKRRLQGHLIAAIQ